MWQTPFIREMFARLVLVSGTQLLVRRFFWRDRVAVLLYHDPDPAVLDSHLTYLKSFCDFVDLSQAVTPGTGRPRAAITFDDGHAGNAKLVPVFIAHGVRPTIYICTGVVGNPRMHWWMHPAAERSGIERLKGVTNSQRLADLQGHGFQQDATCDSSRTGLSKREIEEMTPYVDFQSHTRFHPILTKCDDDECSDEVARSKAEVEAITGGPCQHFAFPNGDYGQREIELLKQYGYCSARTVDVGWNDETTDPFRIKAVEIRDDASLTWFAAQLTGLFQYARYLVQGGGILGKKPQN
jgi:peptidoglycan/xylan/chitin deacetylase (PgdA/CDA1 family)